MLGAHPIEHQGVNGVVFAVFAPNAKRVSVVGDFNAWDGRRHAMRVRGNGFWEIFVPGAKPGDKYKFEILGAHGALIPLKSDPVAFTAEMRPLTASLSRTSRSCPIRTRRVPHPNALDAPMSIYEVHLGSWRKRGEHGEFLVDRSRDGRATAGLCADMGFTMSNFCRSPSIRSMAPGVISRSDCSARRRTKYRLCLDKQDHAVVDGEIDKARGASRRRRMPTPPTAPTYAPSTARRT